MIRRCERGDFEEILEVINDGATAYRGIIPADCWKEPYMPKEELAREMVEGVLFWGWYERKRLIGVMGIQQVQEVTLIRHAYVRTTQRNRGIGVKLLTHLRGVTNRPILIGTWKSATWAVRFYEKHGFRRLSGVEKDRLLKKYWTVPERQIRASVVLADQRWFEGSKG